MAFSWQLRRSTSRSPPPPPEKIALCGSRPLSHCTNLNKKCAEQPRISMPNSQEVCRTAKKLTPWQFLTIRLLVSSPHYYSRGIPKKPSRPLRTPLRIIKKLLRTITTCQKLNKMPPRNSQDAVKKLSTHCSIFL